MTFTALMLSTRRNLSQMIPLETGIVGCQFFLNLLSFIGGLLPNFTELPHDKNSFKVLKLDFFGGLHLGFKLPSKEESVKCVET